MNINKHVHSSRGDNFYQSDTNDMEGPIIFCCDLLLFSCECSFSYNYTKTLIEQILGLQRINLVDLFDQ